jgi:Ca2+-binding EF-hand superfamily protein
MCCQGLLLNLVAKHLSPDEIGSLKESFLAMDEDGSGFLTVRRRAVVHGC